LKGRGTVEEVERYEGKGIGGIVRGDGTRRLEGVGEVRRAEDVERGEDEGVEGEEMDRVDCNGISVKSKRRKYEKTLTKGKEKARCKRREER